MTEHTNVTRENLRRYAVSRSLWRTPDVISAVRKLGYVQADPIRAPARAQDLILFQRVDDYRADDLERSYPTLPVFEDTIYNYGFFPAEHTKLLHPRVLSPRWQAWLHEHRALAKKLAALLKERDELHPRDAESILQAGRRTNGWGGTSSTTTMLLDALHRQGQARVARREAGIRVYARAHPVDPLSPTERADGLIAVIVNLYAPMTQSALMPFLRWMSEVRPGVDCFARFEHAVKRGTLRREKVDGVDYVWPAQESMTSPVADEVRLLAPFDPVVWDRKRFLHLWGWDYKFEAYTPAHKRVRGYYALPMLWRDAVIGWANVRIDGANVIAEPGLAVDTHPGKEFTRALELEVQRIARFLSGR